MPCLTLDIWFWFPLTPDIACDCAGPGQWTGFGLEDMTRRDWLLLCACPPSSFCPAQTPGMDPTPQACLICLYLTQPFPHPTACHLGFFVPTSLAQTAAQFRWITPMGLVCLPNCNPLGFLGGWVDPACLPSQFQQPSPPWPLTFQLCVVGAEPFCFWFPISALTVYAQPKLV